MAIGDRIRTAREARGLTQVDLARVLGHVDGTTVSHYESSRRSPDVHNLAAIARSVGVSTDYLLGLTTHPPARYEPVRCPTCRGSGFITEIDDD